MNVEVIVGYSNCTLLDVASKMEDRVDVKLNEVKLDLVIELTHLIETVRSDKTADVTMFRSKLDKYTSADKKQVRMWFEEHIGGTVDYYLVTSLFKLVEFARYSNHWLWFREYAFMDADLNSVLGVSIDGLGDTLSLNETMTFWDTVNVLYSSVSREDKHFIIMVMGFVSMYAVAYNVDVSYLMKKYLWTL